MDIQLTEDDYKDTITRLAIRNAELELRVTTLTRFIEESFVDMPVEEDDPEIRKLVEGADGTGS